MAFSVYAVCFLIAWLAYMAGLVPAEPILYALPVALLFNAALLGVFLSGYNLRFRDPSLTFLQLCAATGFVMYGMYFAEHGRPLLLLLYTVPFLFGAFRLPVRQHILAGVLALAGYALVIYALWRMEAEGLRLNQEVLQWVSLGVVLAWIVIIGQSLKIMRHQAILDPLTGLHNRRHALASLEREQQRRDRGGPPFCVCFLDVDHLKPINDQFGHAVGDAVLKRLARNVGEQLRRIDDFGRFGGDEFIVVLPDTTLEQALVTCERVRACVAAIDLTRLGARGPVSVSIGIAESRPGETPEQLIARADAALYDAKRTGRDRIATAKPTPASVPGIALAT